MNQREYDLGTILKAAEDHSRAHDSYPTLCDIQKKTGFSPERIVEALEYQPKPLGWHLETLQECVSPPCQSLDNNQFVVSGTRRCVLVINRVHYDHPQDTQPEPVLQD